MFTVNRNPTPAELRKFGWAMLGGFGVLGALLWILHGWRTESGLLAWTGAPAQIAAPCLWVAGIVLWVVSRLSPAIARPVYVAWMSVTVPIGIAVSTALLTVLYFVLLPVFSVIVRLGDPLRKKLSRGGAESYWEEHKPYEATLDRMERLF